MINSNSNCTGVYALVNKINHFMYIGSAASKYGFAARLRRHISDLKLNKHHSPILQVHFNRHGEEVFEVWILEECPPSECLKHEQFWLTLNGIESDNKSYNLSPTAGSPLGIKHSLANRQKRSLAQMGRKKAPCSEEAKAKLRAANLGKTYPPEVRAKIAAAGRGRKQSEETKAKRVASNKANPWSEETRRKANKLLAESKSKEYVVWLPGFQEFYVKNLTAFCCQNGLCTTQMVRVAQASLGDYKNWRCRYATDTLADWETKRQVYLSQRPKKKDYLITAPDGTEHKTNNLSEFSRKHNLKQSAMSSMANANTRIYKGWSCRFLVEPEEIRVKRLTLKDKGKDYIVTFPDGQEAHIHNMTEFCRKHNLLPGCMIHLANGINIQHRGYRCRHAE